MTTETLDTLTLDAILADARPALRPVYGVVELAPPCPFCNVPWDPKVTARMAPEQYAGITLYRGELRWFHVECALEMFTHLAKQHHAQCVTCGAPMSRGHTFQAGEPARCRDGRLAQWPGNHERASDWGEIIDYPRTEQ